MKFSAVFALAALSHFQVNVQAACEAKAIVERCVQDQGAALNNCSPSDNSCLCNAHNAVLACYQNCPNDEYMNGQASLRKTQITIYCNAASQTASTSSSTGTSTASTKANSKGASNNNKSDAPEKSGGPSSDSVRSHPMTFLFATVLGAISFF